MNARTLNSVSFLRIIPVSLTTTFQTLGQVVNAWLDANSKTLPKGSVIQIILNFNADWKLQDSVFNQPKTIAADTDKILPIYAPLNNLQVATVSGSATGTIELYIEE